jgi:hypothetical protein
MTKEILGKINKLEQIWFIEKCYFICSANGNPWDSDAKLCIMPIRGIDIIKFNVNKCPITGGFDFESSIDKAIEYFNIFRIIYYNTKTFFVKLKHIL